MSERNAKAGRRELVLACATRGAVLALAAARALLLQLWPMSTMRTVRLLAAILIALGLELDAHWGDEG